VGRTRKKQLPGSRWMRVQHREIVKRDGSRVPDELFGEVKAGRGIWEHSKAEKGSRERSL